MSASFKKRLTENAPIICGEGYLFELERRGYLQAGPFVPTVVLEHPDVVRQLHREFVRAGSDVVQALTYYAHRDKLKVIGKEDVVEQLNRQALRIAQEVAIEEGVLMAGNICNTWVYNPHDSASHEEVRSMYDEQVKWAKDAGADFIIAETIFYVGEARIALEVIKKYDLPAVITFGSAGGKSSDGYEWDEACDILARDGADVVGLNCTRGPHTMIPLLEKIKARVSTPVAAVPVPYRTNDTYNNFQKLKNTDGQDAFPVNLDPFLLTRREIEDFGREVTRLGIEYVGLCCGAQPYHLRSLAETLGRRPRASAYSPDMSKHALLGDITREHEQAFLKEWHAHESETTAS